MVKCFYIPQGPLRILNMEIRYKVADECDIDIIYFEIVKSVGNSRYIMKNKTK